MGIPSYYRTLITKIPHAIQKVAPAAVSTLVVDMNCMIYHVLREPKMLATPYPSHSASSSNSGSEGLAWEKTLQGEVCRYLTHIWRAAGAPLHTYIALDGVVPYAKIKQQRFRRFKSAASKPDDKSEWDANTITPGTAFMKHMGDALRSAGAKFHWQISDTDEPGEGEHKVLRWLLSNKLTEGPIVVYGLDADLILLCLLAGDKLGEAYPLFLLREATAFGKLVRLGEGEEAELCFFKVGTLRKSLQRGSEWSREQFYDYIFGMSFCGNDFLPTGLSLRIRDDGHSILLACLETLWKSGKHLVEFRDGVAIPCQEGLKAFAKLMLSQEERLVITTIKRKMTARLGESDEDNLPIREQAERPLITVVGERILLRPGWQAIYSRLALGDADKEHRRKCSHDYWQGWCWILNYYQGLPVDLEWVYAAGYPPTWKDLLDFFHLPTKEVPTRIPLKPQEQLAIVLPLRSWGLLYDTPYRRLPIKLPQFWPDKFHVETFGKRFGWECEPLIPMLTPQRLRVECALTAPTNESQPI